MVRTEIQYKRITTLLGTMIPNTYFDFKWDLHQYS
jgi:hypothetical protein